MEWRKKYRKYKPLRQPATCNDCHKKTITSAYHKICGPCARERRVCPFCCTRGRPRQTAEEKEEGDGDYAAGDGEEVEGAEAGESDMDDEVGGDGEERVSHRGGSGAGGRGAGGRGEGGWQDGTTGGGGAVAEADMVEG